MELLASLAKKYIWWKPVSEAVQMPQRVMAQVMNMGDYQDVLLLTQAVGEPVLAQVLASAQAGQFNAKSWAYWHYRLGLCEAEAVPTLPVRRFVG